jgi:membrane peptidoglycan carboxypeptidase
LFSILWVLWNYWTLRLIDTSLGSIVLRDAQGTILTQKWRAWWYQKAYNRTLDSTLIQSIIEIEDRRFFEHDWVDIIWKIWALQENIWAGKIVRGWSTITEQYIKNTYYRWVARTYGQKLREFSNAVFIEITTGKEDILRDYLNSLYFGNGIYGLQTWIDTSYGWRDIHTLSENEILNTLDKIQKPNRGMEDISYKTHIAERLGFSGTITSPKEKPQSYYKDDFPLLTERILEEQSKYCHGEENILIQFLHTDYDRTKICRSDIDLQLSIQLEDMKYAASLVRWILWPLEKENIKNAAIYAIDPKNNKVRVYVANRENESLATKNIDMIQEKRSVGSILKPFIYLQALQDGADPEDLILDSMRVYPTGENDTYFIPQNYIPRAYW